MQGLGSSCLDSEKEGVEVERLVTRVGSGTQGGAVGST